MHGCTPRFNPLPFHRLCYHGTMPLLYHDHQLAIYDKPVGEPTQPGRDDDRSALASAELATGARLYVVHRLDQRASGVVVFARSEQSAAELSDLLREREIRRTYLAIVHGAVVPDHGRLEHRLVRDGRSNKSRIASEGKPAVLSYRTIARGERYTLLEVSLETGRHHQIRVQLSAAGWPIRGDVKYGARRTIKGGGIDLHAYSVSVPQADGSTVVATVPPPDLDLWHVLVPADYLGEPTVNRTETR